MGNQILDTAVTCQHFLMMTSALGRSFYFNLFAHLDMYLELHPLKVGQLKHFKIFSQEDYVHFMLLLSPMVVCFLDYFLGL